MRIFTPDFYDQFCCIASDCPDSCCKEWEVDVDPDTAARYLALPGDLGDRLRQVLRMQEDGSACMTIEDGRCPMWQADGLCRIHAQLGHDALSQICREYPRIRHDYGDFIEMGLELSCPEAARLIFSSEYNFTRADVDSAEEITYDRALMDTLLRSREEAVCFLNESSLPIAHRLAVLLLYAYDVQSEIDGGEVACITVERNLSDAYRYKVAADFDTFIDFFRKLEILTPQWTQLLDNPALNSSWDPRLIAFVRYLIYRYWLQAVSDYDLVCRVKFVITATLIVHMLGADTIATAQLFSKEIENDPDNVDAILDAAYTSPTFTDDRLLGLLFL